MSTPTKRFPPFQATPRRSLDEGFPAEPPGIVATRQEIAIVRMLADELERCLDKGIDGYTLRAQLAQGLALLGERVTETAAAMTDIEEHSGIHLVLAP